MCNQDFANFSIHTRDLRVEILHVYSYKAKIKSSKYIQTLKVYKNFGFTVDKADTHVDVTFRYKDYAWHSEGADSRYKSL